MQNKNKKPRNLPLPPQLFLRGLHILLQLPNRIFKGRPSIIDLINNENILANQIGHFETTQIEPLRSGDFCAGDFFGVVGAAEVFVEGESDGLDGDVGLVGAFEEGSFRVS